MKLWITSSGQRTYKDLLRLSSTLTMLTLLSWEVWQVGHCDHLNFIKYTVTNPSDVISMGTPHFSVSNCAVNFQLIVTSPSLTVEMNPWTAPGCAVSIYTWFGSTTLQYLQQRGDLSKTHQAGTWNSPGQLSAFLTWRLQQQFWTSPAAQK